MTRETNTVDLSIVIVSWNTRNLLRECLRSVYDNLDNVRAEVFVVDNASADGSAEMVRREFPQVCLICNDSNRGFAAANNQAMRHAASRFILLLNSDTCVINDVFTQTLHYMQQHPDVGVLGCQVLNTDRTIQRTCFRDPDLLTLSLVTTGLHRLPRPALFGRHEMRQWDRRSARDVDVVTGCYMCVRQQAIEDVGLFDEQFFFYAEEADWCRRFREANWNVRFAPVGQIIHHGAASAMQLDERRTIMLGEALVRLLYKRRGKFIAVIAWLLLLAFNTSRSVIWAIVAVCTFRRSARHRALLFGRAALQFLKAWPSGTGTNADNGNSSAPAINVEVSAPPRRYSMTRATGSSDPTSMADVEQKMIHDKRRRVLAVASGGGHWVQLLRLRPALAGNDVTFVTVNRSAQDEIGDERLFIVPDATRWTKLRLIALVIHMFIIVARTRPNVVISTGAAPGYFALLFGKLFGARTIWIDSIANVEHLSLSGQKARRLADTTLTQWEHLAEEDSDGLVYAGAVV